jgi:hypothetical protein
MSQSDQSAGFKFVVTNIRLNGGSEHSLAQEVWDVLYKHATALPDDFVA